MNQNNGGGLTHWKKLHNPDYLGAYAIEPGTEPIYTIDYVREESVTGPDGKKETCMVVHFKEAGIKPMILNATNAKTINKIYDTPYIEQWQGKPIQIYVAKVKAFGDMTDALRIRPMIPKVQLPVLDKSHPKWPDAVSKVQSGATTREAISKYYIVSDQVWEELKKGGKNA